MPRCPVSITALATSSDGRRVARKGRHWAATLGLAGYGRWGGPKQNESEQVEVYGHGRNYCSRPPPKTLERLQLLQQRLISRAGGSVRPRSELLLCCNDSKLIRWKCTATVGTTAHAKCDVNGTALSRRLHTSHNIQSGMGGPKIWSDRSCCGNDSQSHEQVEVYGHGRNYCSFGLCLHLPVLPT